MTARKYFIIVWSVVMGYVFCVEYLSHGDSLAFVLIFTVIFTGSVGLFFTVYLWLRWLGVGVDHEKNND